MPTPNPNPNTWESYIANMFTVRTLFGFANACQHFFLHF